MTLHVHDAEQGSEEWLQARCGLLTASTIGKLITPTLKVANNDTSRRLVSSLAAERITGIVEPIFITSDMQRGIDEEPLARDMYAEVNNETVTEVGLMVREDNGVRLGFSADGLVCEEGLIEIKSRNQRRQVETILSDEVPPENRLQIQCGLFVSGREWLDFISYSAGMALYVKRVYPDAKAHSVIAEAAAKFEEDVQAIVDQYTAATRDLPVAEPRVDLDGMVI